jgi:hypothetical protein
MNKIEYIPKGGMCAGCYYREGDFSELEFRKMTAIKKPDENNIVIVKCDDYRKPDDELAPKPSSCYDDPSSLHSPLPSS